MQRQIVRCFICAVLLAHCAWADLQTIDLSGSWRFAIDANDQGLNNLWFNEDLSDTIQLPGTMDQNKKGYRNENRDFTEHLSRPFAYEGKAWYQKDIQIPKQWGNKRIILSLERSKITRLWVDDKFVAADNCLGVPQVHDVSEFLSPGKHTLTICVDNKIRPGVSGGHQITDQTQTNWNGIIGKIFLRASDKVWIDSVLVYPDVSAKKIAVHVTLGQQLEKSASGTLQISAKIFNSKSSHVVAPKAYSFENIEKTTALKYEYELGDDALLWDEFSPDLYTLTIKLKAAVAEKNFKQQYQTTFGLREFKTRGTQFTINGRPTFLRGKCDAMTNPILGHPSMKTKDWIRIFKIAKSHGINHYRFHSSTPPKAAFEAADIVGVYVQPELYNFSDDLSQSPEGAQYTKDEALRILKVYGNHPSFVMFALGNEMFHGRGVRAEIVRALRDFDQTRLYAQASNYELSAEGFAEGDDYWVAVRANPKASEADAAVRGSFSHADLPLGHIQTQPPSTRYDYSKALVNTFVPVVGHEIGQFQMYPDFDEIKKYTGVQKPWNLEVFRKRLKEAGMLDQWKDFFRASGALSIICYREEIEAALRTPGFGGFELLDLQDFPGQGTALVGVLDAFMDSKGLITPEKWRQFCSETVPLLRFDKYIWTADQTFTADAQVAHYGKEKLSADFSWCFKNAKGWVIDRSKIPSVQVTSGQVFDICKIEIPLNNCESPAKYTIEIKIGANTNEYPIWVYPPELSIDLSPKVLISRSWDKTKQQLQNGLSVLFIPELSDLVNSIEGFWASDFWCYPTFRSVCQNMNKPISPGTLGILCDPSHPALKAFTTESYSNWQWWYLIMNSRAMILDTTEKDFRPIVQVIDNFDRNHKLAMLFECKVGNGKLLVCSMDLPCLENHPEAKQMLWSLYEYMKSSAFKPKESYSAEFIGQMLFEKAQGSVTPKPELFER